MGYTLSELRAIAEGTSEFDHMMTMDEAASMYVLDEAFFGKKPVAKIQAAMDKSNTPWTSTPTCPAKTNCK